MPGADIRVRPAYEADHEAACTILDAADRLHLEGAPWLFRTPERPAFPREHFAEFLNARRAGALVAETDRVIGIVLVLLRASPLLPVVRAVDFGVVDALAVEPASRRRGAGTLLVRSAESWAFERGAAWVELNVYEFNEGARRFYESLGYEVASRRLRKAPR
jgi:ribosomal protein S18 acetylase RimI-like enzyme